MSSAYRPLDPKKQLSVRVRTSVHTKLNAILRIWKAQAEARGEPTDGIDLTYVVDCILTKSADEELAQWGGLPTNEDKWKAVLKAIDEAAKQ